MEEGRRSRTGLDVGCRVDALEAAAKGRRQRPASKEVRDWASRVRPRAGKARALLDGPLALRDCARRADGGLEALVGAADEAWAAGWRRQEKDL